MNNGFMYNLYNPFSSTFNEDIGSTMINRMYPTNIDPITGMPDMTLSGVNINPGQPLADSYITPKQKNEYAILKTIAGGIILGALGLIGVKKGGAWTRQILSKITSPFKGLWQGIKGLFKHSTP